MDDFDLNGKTVILRVDINCPLNQKTLEIEDDNRIKQIMPTLRELSEKNAKVVIIAHQGRKGDWDFCSLDMHAKLLSKHLGKEVRYVDDLYGEVSQMDKKELESKMYQNFEDRFQYPLTVAVFLLAVEALLSDKKRPGIGRILKIARRWRPEQGSREQ